MKNILFEYPTWFLLLCPLVGLAFALLFYLRDRRNASWSQLMVFTLAALRTSAVALIVFLLLGPLIRSVDIQIEPPVVVLAIDQSSSLIIDGDSAALAALINRTETELRDKVGGKFDVVTYSFGAEVREGLNPTFGDEVTQISSLFESLRARYTNRNLGAVVMLSDGIYNRGNNPRYTASGLGAPIYTLALGDTTLRRDALISEVAANRLAFLNNTFPIEAVFRGIELQGETVNYQIESGGQVLQRGSFRPDSRDTEHTARFLLKADKPGVQRYTIRVNPVSGEQTDVNNMRLVFIDVVDSRQKVLILAESPHPDVFAIRSAIEGNENYEVKVSFVSDANPPVLSDCDLLVLHQVPSIETSKQLLADIAQAKKPIFAILGQNSDLRALPQIGIGISLAGARNVVNDVKASLNKSFTLYQPNENLGSLIAELPPLRVPFGEWKLPGSASVILKQQVGRIDTDDPILVFTTYDDRKSATLLGEGVWRWRLADYARNANHQAFDQFIAQIVQYLSLKEDKRLFRVQAPREFMQNERVIMNAELYDAAYTPVNDTEVSVEFTDEEGKTYTFNFSRNDLAYRLDAGMLPVGTYNYRAAVNRDGQRLTDAGSFTIRPFALEAANLRADHRLLFALSDLSGGQMFYPDQVDELVAEIGNSERIQPVSYSTEVLTSIINKFWPLLLILLFLSAEWFIRKRSGTY